MLVRSLQIGNANKPVGSAISCPQMAADPPLGRVLIAVVTGVQDVLVNITEDRFIRIMVGTSLGQTGPLQPRSPHNGPCHLGFLMGCWISIQGHPHRLMRIPSPDTPQESTHILRPFAGEEGPVDAAMVHFVVLLR